MSVMFALQMEGRWTHHVYYQNKIESGKMMMDDLQDIMSALQTIPRGEKFLKISISDNYHLPSPLGSWIYRTQVDWFQQWDYFTSQDIQFMYHIFGKHKWLHHLQIEHSHHSYPLTSLQLEALHCLDLIQGSVTKNKLNYV